SVPAPDRAPWPSRPRRRLHNPEYASESPFDPERRKEWELREVFVHCPVGRSVMLVRIRGQHALRIELVEYLQVSRDLDPTEPGFVVLLAYGDVESEVTRQPLRFVLPEKEHIGADRMVSSRHWIVVEESGPTRRRSERLAGRGDEPGAEQAAPAQGEHGREVHRVAPVVTRNIPHAVLLDLGESQSVGCRDFGLAAPMAQRRLDPPGAGVCPGPPCGHHERRVHRIIREWR